MKNEYLNKLTLAVLKQVKEGISKVRLAKVLYFVFKELVRNNKSAYQDLAFIRMPLGPVPDGFKSLQDNESIKISIRSSGYLSYDTQIYQLNIPGLHITADPVIIKTVDHVKEFTTSQLVGLSHQDATWNQYSNGTVYYMAKADLANQLPDQSSPVSEEMDQQRLQAQLMEGMLDEIVDETSALEYPHLAK